MPVGEVNAAKLTCFVGNAHDCLPPKYITLNGIKLWNGEYSRSNTPSQPNNVWDAMSLGVTPSGIDIDTLGIDPIANPPQYITWSSGILKPGNTSAQVVMYTANDEWNLVYMILSFRNSTTIGSGIISYVVKG